MPIPEHIREQAPPDRGDRAIPASFTVRGGSIAPIDPQVVPDLAEVKQIPSGYWIGNRTVFFGAHVVKRADPD